jgi:hypothetical protein
VDLIVVVVQVVKAEVPEDPHQVEEDKI